MWTYLRTTGELRHDGTLVGHGYSGHGDGLNDPAMEGVPDIGPIPAGAWTIGAPLDPPDHLGPLAMPLTPAPHTNTFGRSAFFMHGDNAAGDQSASHGCIIMNRLIREAVHTAAQAGDNTLSVL
ncbi:MAG: DUF2778 domain-containing protein [Caulobacteraceae bacterium]|nr:DUF2778 domain-containing protein [Caulobacteraceae bacterium]